MENRDYRDFPAVQVGDQVVNNLEFRPLEIKGGLGKWRVQSKGSDGEGLVFLLKLFGATRTKMESLLWRKLTEADIEKAIGRAIAREVSKWRRLGKEPPRGEPIEITLREDDFAPGTSIW